MPIKTISLLSFVMLLCSCSDSADKSPAANNPPAAEPSLSVCNSNPPSDDIGIYHCSWEHRAIVEQRKLGLTLPLREVQIPSSHNSFNSSSYPGVSSNDLNQTRSLLEQLQLDMRSIELDVHWLPHAASGGHAPVLCHGRGAAEEHLGCTPLDRHLSEGLEEIAVFLNSPQGVNQVIILDIEDSLSPAPLSGLGTTTEQAHGAALNTIIAALGDLIYQPPQDGLCHSTPMDISQQDILDAGKQILITGGCGSSDWPKWSFEVNSIRPGQKAHTGFSGYPDCDAADYDFSQYRERWVRLWEDTTVVGAVTNTSLTRMSSQNQQDMLHCGVNFFSLDRVDPNPASVSVGNPAYIGQGINFADLVWSWAPDKPAVDEDLDCAMLDVNDGRFHDIDCSSSLPYACLKSDALASPILDTSNLWQTTGTGEFGAANCSVAYEFNVPRNGWLKQKLLEQMASAGVTQVWINRKEVSPNNWQ